MSEPKQCSYVDRSKTPNVECGYIALATSRYGYCPRHELVVPHEEEERRKQQDKRELEKRRNAKDALRRGARR